MNHLVLSNNNDNSKAKMGQVAPTKALMYNVSENQDHEPLIVETQHHEAGGEPSTWFPLGRLVEQTEP